MQKQHYISNIEKDTINNQNYRTVIWTSYDNHMQLTLMSLLPGQEIGSEIHEGDQFIRVEAGQGVAEIGCNKYLLQDGVAFIIPHGVRHNVINISRTENLKLYSIYSPPEHPSNLIETFKRD